MNKLQIQIFSCILLIPVIFLIVHDIIPHHHHEEGQDGIECSVAIIHQHSCETEATHEQSCESHHNDLENCKACHFDAGYFLNEFIPEIQYFVQCFTEEIFSLNFKIVKQVNTCFNVPVQKSQFPNLLRGPPSQLG